MTCFEFGRDADGESWGAVGEGRLIAVFSENESVDLVSPLDGVSIGTESPGAAPTPRAR